ncbi:MAG: hypothetical protein BGP12_11605 [Rhodospirillales bacterium 70-18]|nr:hypothetical protein [Rhodospirillales bacterium]OJY68439.1 MAG: hypothetical protein BGP12_11605 [Rhodospirillales bacterium 70-18]
MSGVRLRIDRLVLDGVAPGDRARVVAAFRAELARLLAAGGADVAAGARPGHVAMLPAGADAGSAGRAAAASVFSAIGGAGR